MVIEKLVAKAICEPLTIFIGEIFFMTKILFVAVLLVGINSFAANSNFYECGGLAGVDEYRVGIDLNRKIAGFFDNDSTSMMKLVKVESLETYPPQTQMIFQGKEASYDGYLKLYFNLTAKSVTLYSIAKGKSTLVGRAKCALSKPWSW